MMHFLDIQVYKEYSDGQSESAPTSIFYFKSA